MTGVGDDGKMKYLSSNELEWIRGVLNDCTCGTNIIYCDNSKKPIILSSVHKNGVELSTYSPDYDKERLIVSAIPAQNSINTSKKTFLVITVSVTCHLQDLTL